MGNIFSFFVYDPLYNLLVLIYDLSPIQDFGIAIIAVTLIIKFVLIPLSRKQIESQKKMAEMQPRIKEIQDKHKGNKEEQSKALMEFYKETKTNPFAGCLPMIVQLIFLIAIYRVLFNISEAGLLVDPNTLYSFIPDPGQINKMFLGIVDLSSALNLGHLTLMSVPHIILILAAAGAQYVQAKMMMAKQPKKEPAKDGKPDFAQMMTKQMLYLGPLLTLFIGVKFPAGLALYWLVSTGFMIIQQKRLEKKKEEEK